MAGLRDWKRLGNASPAAGRPLAAWRRPPSRAGAATKPVGSSTWMHLDLEVCTRGPWKAAATKWASIGGIAGRDGPWKAVAKLFGARGTPRLNGSIRRFCPGSPSASRPAGLRTCRSTAHRKDRDHQDRKDRWCRFPLACAGSLGSSGSRLVLYYHYRVLAVSDYLTPDRQ